MIPPAFDYHAPATIPEAVALLTRYRDTAKVLSGGQSLLPLLKLRLAQSEHLVDIGRIPGLEYVEEKGGMLCIGGCTREATLERSELVRARHPILIDTTKVIVSPCAIEFAAARPIRRFASAFTEERWSKEESRLLSGLKTAPP